MTMVRFLPAALLIAFTGSMTLGSAGAQTSMPPNQVSPFKDTSMLKPPAGAKVAIIEFEDLECPACAKAFPIVHEAVNHYHIPLEERDFPLRMHVWSHEAAIYARYMKDTISPELAMDYRRQVFASQFRISSKDDMNNFTKQFLASKGKQFPFVVDPTGQFAREVQADADLGDRLGLNETPTIVVVSSKGWIQVKDVMQLYAAIDQAQAAAGRSTASAPAPTNKHINVAGKR